MPDNHSHDLDPEIAIRIARELLDSAEANRCMNCVLTQYINVGSILLAAIPEAGRYATIAKLTLKLVEGSALIAADMNDDALLSALNEAQGATKQ